MTTWDEAAKKAEELSQGVFIKLKDGQKVKGVFRSLPIFDSKHFVDNKPQACVGEGCELCNQGIPRTNRIYVNMAVQDDSGFAMRLFPFSPTVFKRLNSMRVEITTPFEDTLFTIKREGSGTETEYIITNVGVITPEEQIEIGKLKLNTIDKNSNENGVPF